MTTPVTSTALGQEKVDLVIVGAGAAASVFAAKAAQAGKQVLMLEAGPKRSAADLISSQIWARRLKWGGAWVEEEGDHKIGHGFNAGWGTGGSALHHYGVWPRLHAEDFKTHTLYGMGYDWPLEYDDLRPFYDRVQQEVGISGDAAAETWRPPGAAYPLPPLPVFAQGRVIAQGFQAKGLQVAPIPLAITSQPYHGRRACLYDGWCDAGCPIGALGNPLTVYLPQAFNGKARLRNHATVSRILTNPRGDKAIGVEFYDTSGQLHTQMAEVVVLAAFAIQTPRLLLVSATARHPNGLANHHGMVGKCLMTHPAYNIYGLFQQETLPHLGVTGGQLINQDGYGNKTAMADAYGSYQWLIANAVKPNDLLGISASHPDLYGAKLASFMQQAVRHFGTMVGVAEDIARPENQVVLSQQQDAHGVPLAKTIHNMHPLSEPLCRHMVQEGLDIFAAAGAQHPWHGPRVGMHLMGGTLMGDDRLTSVTDSYGRCHDIGNLFIAGPGLFPSSGAVNPTFTIHALSLRSVEFLLREWHAII